MSDNHDCTILLMGQFAQRIFKIWWPLHPSHHAAKH